MSSSNNYSQIFVFGDSLSDTGNSFALTLGAIPPEPPYFSGRFSNGLVAVEYLSEDLGLTLNPYFDDEKGNNFAVGGATTGTGNTSNDDIAPFLPEVTLPGVLEQINAYERSLEDGSVDRDALHIVWAGANDFLDYLADVVPADPAVLLEAGIDNTVNNVNSLTDLGAENIVVPNLPSLGSLPFSREFESEATALTIAYNGGLSLALDDLNSEYSETEVIEVDLFTTNENIVANPEQFGFGNISDPLLESGLDPSETTGFFYWDLFHPTTEAQTLFGDAIAQTIEGEIPQPTFNDLIGTEAEDSISGTEAEDNIDGFAGGDTIAGGKGDDRLEGQLGHDSLFGQEGDDIIDGGEDSDLISGGDDDDLLFGSGGDDSIQGNDGKDILIGGSDRDYLQGGADADYLLGGVNNDYLRGDGGNDTLNGGDNDDLLAGGLGDDLIDGGAGSDIVQYSQPQENFIFKGNSDRLEVIGTEGKDTLEGVEALEFTDGTVDTDSLNFLPAPLYDEIETIETTIPDTEDAIDIYLPANPQDKVPVAIFLQGANVDKSNYSIFAETVASYGFAVVVPNNLRTVELPPPTGNVTGFIPELPQVNEVYDYISSSESPIVNAIAEDNLVFLGHSLGGVAGLYGLTGTSDPQRLLGEFATRSDAEGSRPEELAGGVFFGTDLIQTIGADEPPEPVPAIDNEDLPTALILGTEDGISFPDKTVATYDEIQDPPKALISIEGVNHFGITDLNDPLNPPSTPEEVPLITTEPNPQTVSQKISIDTIATWSSLFLRATVLDDEAAFDFVFGGGDELDSSVSVVSELPADF